MEAIGKKGERAAAAYLQSIGFAITANNYKTRYGEVDVIARNDTYLVFAEVKTRKAPFTDSGIFAVNARKQARLRATAQLYLSQHPCSLQPRFDVIIVAHENGRYSIESHFENAF